MFSYEGAIARLEWVKEVNSLWSRGLLQPEKILHMEYLQYLKSLLETVSQVDFKFDIMNWSVETQKSGSIRKRIGTLSPTSS